MEVSMDSTNTNLPPQTHPYPTSPSTGGRKRPIEDTHDIPSRPAKNHAEDPKTTALDDKENTTTTSSSFSPSPSKQSTTESPAPAQPDVVDSGAGPTSLSESTMNTVPDSSSNMNPPSEGSATTPAAKKRKLSPASKQQEKEAKERQRLEEKAKREEEKAKREEEKAKKEEERKAKEEEKKKRDAEREEERKKKDERRRVKEEEKVAREEEKRKKEAAKEEEKRKKEAAKEEEKRKKEEEKLKKERAQPKLNAFFAKPKPVSQPGPSTASHSPSKATRDAPPADAGAESRPTLSDYQRLFPDFFLQSHTTVAPVNRFERDTQALQHMRDKVDAQMKAAANPAPRARFRPSELFQMIPYQRRRGRIPASVKEILLQMQNLGDQPETSEAVQRPRNLLKQVRMKSLKFGEDVRPPYQGTYTRRMPVAEAHRLMRNPFHRGLPETNYDYESEAEWEEPEEGEELDSEEEEDVSEDGEDDLDGFLDDEGDDQQAPGPGKRRLIVGDLEPACSGLQWQSDHPGGTSVDPELQRYRIETISDAVTFPIDPFSTAYWTPAPAPVGAGPAGPGRSSLHAFLGGAPSAGTAGSAGGAEGAGPGRTKRAFPADQLEEFKRAVDGSDLSKLGLIEILKKRFPKVSKEVLKETLNSVATRVGQKEVDKKWVCQ
ncbi:putative chromatin assembly factor 1 subunit A [Aspergillus candidus]|uniref:Chromatin assembly factor 1 subunit A-domain-containing protein n=1 Tax=Aspergillus candidus TaxID=41067 RepID=A0A2I2FP39_ASPCN|nr:chromatin assembly factor 1 subunit A-domain-containing protein [Aspergillus candidus]PLB42378.1 chromatin assembly factor 1 subunit A-domain-containing protein [Aspergillus candidus]